jgi:DNA processing protein
VHAELDIDNLQLAITAVRHGRGARRLAAQIRREGSAAVEHLYEDLAPDSRSEVVAEARVLADEGIEALLLEHDSYPAALAKERQAPPALFYRGNRDLLAAKSIGMCGARRASAQGLKAARVCAEEIARCGLVVVSGYARGVDTEAHAGALDVGGGTVMVLAEGIRRFKIKGWLASRSYDPSQVVVISQFTPSHTWAVGAAMSRNAVIVGLSLGIVVIEAGDSGGTLNAGLQALDNGRTVFALEFRREMPPGNKILLDRGAVPVGSRGQMRHRIRELLGGAQPGQHPLPLMRSDIDVVVTPGHQAQDAALG